MSSQATGTGVSADEMMTVAASRALRDGAVLFVGIGLPSTGANLARRTHAPNLVLVYESGCIGSKPSTAASHPLPPAPTPSRKRPTLTSSRLIRSFAKGTECR